jgi:hypothetical protein
MLLLGVVLGYLMLLRRDLWGVFPSPGWRSAHTHLIMVGAVLQLIIGTAWWLFPRPPRDAPQAPEAALHATWWALTLGTLLRAGAEIATWPPGALLGGTCQVVGITAALVGLRRRVVPSRNPAAR